MPKTRHFLKNAWKISLLFNLDLLKDIPRIAYLRQTLIFGTNYRQQSLYLVLLGSFQRDSTGPQHLELIKFDLRALKRECYGLSAFFGFFWL